MSKKVAKWKTKEGRTVISAKVEGEVVSPAGHWYRGENCNFYPRKPDQYNMGWLWRNVVEGWQPPEPFVTKKTAIMPFGSCFANNIRSHLLKIGYNVSMQAKNISFFGSGMVNTYTIAQQFEWAFDGLDMAEKVWIPDLAKRPDLSEKNRSKTKSAFEDIDLFVVTLGLSEVWYDKKTGTVFWRAVPAETFDPRHHGFRVTTVSENKSNIERIVTFCKKANPACRVVLTLSPVRMRATFRPVSAVTANSASKAILRAAIDEYMREKEDPDVFYWPSYEILEAHDQRYLDDNSHPRPEIVQKIMRLFVRAYCKR